MKCICVYKGIPLKLNKYIRKSVCKVYGIYFTNVFIFDCTFINYMVKYVNKGMVARWNL